MSNTPVSKEHWSMWLGEMPMPEGATFDMMWAAVDAIQKIEDREYDIEQLRWYESQWRTTLARYKELEARDDDEAKEKIVHVKESLKLIKEGILLFQERLKEYE